MPTVTWDAAFELAPADADEYKYGANKIRQLKLGISERLEVEHDFKTSGLHKPGKVSVMFEGTTANIAALTGMSAGAIAYDTDLSVHKRYNGATWDTRSFTLVEVEAYVDSIAPVLPGVFSKLKVKNNSGTPASQIDIDADLVNVVNGTGEVLSLTGVNLTVNCATTGANALDTGTLSNSHYYHFFVIAKDDGTTAGLASLSTTSPSMPTDYNYKKLVSTIYYVGDAFRLINQYDKLLHYVGAALSMYTSTAATWAAKDISVFVPPNALTVLIQPYSVGSMLHAIAWDDTPINTRVFMNLTTGLTLLSVQATLSTMSYPLNPAAPQTIYAIGYDANDRGGCYLNGYELDI